ncbi:hypothetical protein NQZ79_g7571 [Umbelopsis isabellina]|nr:hypothetical protein NQZ79_g7571 [Umbelopsis isabellina]
MMKVTILVLMLCMLLGTVFCWNEGYDHEHDHKHEHEEDIPNAETFTITVTDFITTTVTAPVTDFVTTTVTTPVTDFVTTTITTPVTDSITTTVTATPSTCPNTKTACGNNGACIDCTNAGTSPNVMCSDGVCTCPNTNNACSSVANCGACGGDTPNCFEGTCTCPNHSSACTNGSLGPGTCSACTDTNQICNAGNCCLPGGSQCTTDGDCCSSTCNGGVCLSTLGCGQFGRTYQYDGYGQASVYSPTDCLNICLGESGAAYFSLFFDVTDNLYFCICYTSVYVFIPITAANNQCIVVDGYNYGLNTGGDNAPAESEYVYRITH